MWLRAAGLIGQSLALGGAAFALIVLPLARATPGLEAGRRVVLHLAAGGAFVVAVAEVGWLACLAGAFADASGWPAGALVGTAVGGVGLARATVAIVAAVAAWVVCLAPTARTAAAALATTAVLLPLT